VGDGEWEEGGTNGMLPTEVEVMGILVVIVTIKIV
jgi:hypothetical protein